MISGLSLPAALAAPPAALPAAPATAGTPGFAQALLAADPPADAAPEPAREDPAARSSEPPQARRSQQALRSGSRSPVGTTMTDKAITSAGTDAENQSSSAVVPREEDPLASIAAHDAPPNLQALLAGLQQPSDPVPTAPWGAPALALPDSTNVNTTLPPAHATVRGLVRLEPESAVAKPTPPLISGDGTGPTSRSPAAATLVSDAGSTDTPPAVTSEAFVPGPVAPGNPLTQATSTPAAPAAAGASPSATYARIAASPHSAAFGPELGAQISTFIRHGVERAQLQLHPAELGPVTVQILVEGASAQVHLWAEQPGTRLALEQAMPALAGQLRESGLTLTGGGVFEQPRQAPEQKQRETGTGPSATAHPTADPASLAFAAPARRRGLVDLIA